MWLRGQMEYVLQRREIAIKPGRKWKAERVSKIKRALNSDP
jgi:hypothetical protein